MAQVCCNDNKSLIAPVKQCRSVEFTQLKGECLQFSGHPSRVFMTGFPREYQLPSGSTEQLHPTYRNPVYQSDSRAVASEDRAKNGAARLSVIR